MDKPHQDKPPKMPTENYNYHHKLVEEWRTDLKPLNVDQPEGPSFKVHSLTEVFQSHFLPLFCCFGSLTLVLPGKFLSPFLLWAL